MTMTSWGALVGDGATTAMMALGPFAAARRRSPLQRLPKRHRTTAPASTATSTDAKTGTDPAPEEHPHVALVVNPTKVRDADSERDWFLTWNRRLKLDDPQILATTASDPGGGQTRLALEKSPQTVIAYGGDGTVRSVATALAGTGVPLGILPAGTGNLLARNLSLPLADVDEAARIALSGPIRMVDIGRAELDTSGEDHDPRRQAFCVMAGIGFDAEVMAEVHPKLKRRLGWMAYVIAGARRLNGRRLRVTMRLDDGETIHRRVRSIVVGNCGDLVGGVPLLPGAEIDDGRLDVVVASPRGVFGWGAVVALVLTRSRRGHPSVQHFTCQKIEIRTERPVQAQIDGDDVGRIRAFRAAVDPGALAVRAPMPLAARQARTETRRSLLRSDRAAAALARLPRRSR